MRGRGRARALGLPCGGQGLDPHPAGITQLHELGHLVEGLPGGVVPAPAEQFHFETILDPVEVGVPAGDHQGHQGKGGRVIGQEGRQDMGLEMVHPGQGQLVGEGQGLGHRHADDQGADQPGALGHGQAVQVAQGHPGLGQGALNHRQDVFQVPPGGDLRHHPAVGGVGLELGGHHGGQDTAAVGHHRGRGFIAGGFDA